MAGKGQGQKTLESHLPLLKMQPCNYRQVLLLLLELLGSLAHLSELWAVNHRARAKSQGMSPGRPLHERAPPSRAACSAQQRHLQVTPSKTAPHTPTLASSPKGRGGAARLGHPTTNGKKAEMLCNPPHPPGRANCLSKDPHARWEIPFSTTKIKKYKGFSKWPWTMRVIFF